MRVMKKIVLSLIAMFALVLVIHVPTNAASGGVNMVSYNDDSVTVSWPAQSSTSYRTVCGYVIADKNDNILATVQGADTTSTTISGLGQGYVNSVWVYSVYLDNYGSTKTGYIGYACVNTKPAKISKSDFGLAYLVNNKIKVGANYDYSKVSGVEVKIYNLSTGKKYKSGNMSNYYTVKYNTAYRYSVRPYYTNPDTKTQAYGDWSSWRYFSITSGKSVYTPSKRTSGITFTLKKGTGISKYKIQISTKKNSGFKTVKTVKVGSKSTIKATIKKFNGKSFAKNKTYYIRICPVLKGNHSSDSYGTYSFSFYR